MKKKDIINIYSYSYSNLKYGELDRDDIFHCPVLAVIKYVVDQFLQSLPKDTLILITFYRGSVLTCTGLLINLLSQCSQGSRYNRYSGVDQMIKSYQLLKAFLFTIKPNEL